MGNFIKTIACAVVRLYIAEALKAVIDDRFQLDQKINNAAIDLSAALLNQPKMEGGEY